MPGTVIHDLIQTGGQINIHTFLSDKSSFNIVLPPGNVMYGYGHILCACLNL